MKKVKITIVLIFISIVTCFSQKEANVGNSYLFTDSITLYEVSSSGFALNGTMTFDKISEVNYELTGYTRNFDKNNIFKIIDIYENTYIIKAYLIDYADNAKLFALSDSNLKTKAKLLIGEHPKWGFVSSAIMLPVKIRFGDGEDEDNSRRFNFEGNVNIGIAAGIKLRVSKSNSSYLNLMVGLNIGSTKLTEENTNGGVSNDTNTSILTPFTGLLFEYDGFQIGAFVGWDHISGKLGKKWHYQGNTWLGIGVGYNIFSSKGKVDASEESD